MSFTLTFPPPASFFHHDLSSIAATIQDERTYIYPNILSGGARVLIFNGEADACGALRFPAPILLALAGVYRRTAVPVSAATGSGVCSACVCSGSAC